jgi:hypothetical protein
VLLSTKSHISRHDGLAISRTRLSVEIQLNRGILHISEYVRKELRFIYFYRSQLLLRTLLHQLIPRNETPNHCIRAALPFQANLRIFVTSAKSPPNLRVSLWNRLPAAPVPQGGGILPRGPKKFTQKKTTNNK